MTAASLPATEQVVDVSADDVSPWGSPRQRAAQRRNKHHALLATAARLFKRQGFDATSLDQMAGQLGITKPTLYHYVRSKSELIHACAMQGWAQAIGRVQEALQTPGPECLQQALKAYAQVVASDFGWCMVRISEYAQDAVLKKEIAQQRQALEQCLAAAAQVPALPLPMLLRALEGLVLALPASQWRSAITVLAAPVAPTCLLAPEVSEGTKQEVALPSALAGAAADRSDHWVPQTTVQPEPEPEPGQSNILDVFANQQDMLGLPTIQKLCEESVKHRKKSPKVDAQISLF